MNGNILNLLGDEDIGRVTRVFNQVQDDRDRRSLHNASRVSPGRGDLEGVRTRQESRAIGQGKVIVASALVELAILGYGSIRCMAEVASFVREVSTQNCTLVRDWTAEWGW